MGKENEQGDLYAKLGVASNKSDIKENFDEILTKEYPYAFVNIDIDPSNPEGRITMHADGDGSKLIQRFLDFYYYEGENESVFAGMVDDALSMNTSDIAASGFVRTMKFVDIFDCGNAELKKTIVSQIKKRFGELIKLYSAFGFDIKFIAGETADLPYQVKTGVFNVVITAWADKSDIITGEVQVGDVILGLHSDGQAIWEDKPNSGAMSNGQTLLRSGAMSIDFNANYELGDGEFYKGQYCPNDCPSILEGMTVGEAILSPTRQWAIVIRKIINLLKERDLFHMLHGISINTGGGATKVANIGHGVTYVKNMPEPSPLFRFIQEETGQPWKHMFTTFNCKIGVDIVGENNVEFKNTVKEAVDHCGLEMSELGFVYYSNDEKNHVTLNTPYGRFEY
jgi:phosphoribosylformylglycinamidine cyclo-ligase